MLPLVVTVALLVVAAVLDRDGGLRRFVVTAGAAIGVVVVFGLLLAT